MEKRIVYIKSLRIYVLKKQLEKQILNDLKKITLQSEE